MGIPYYGQLELSEDDFGIDLPALPDRRLDRRRAYGIGPGATVPLATKRTLRGFLNIRYYWETGARSSLQGHTLVIALHKHSGEVRF